MVKAIISRPARSYFLSRTVELVVFQHGWSNLGDLVGKDDCIVLIPIAIMGSDEVTIEEWKTARQTTFKFTNASELIMTGRCSMWIPAENKVVCVVLCVGRDKG